MPGMSEATVYEALGLRAPEAEGENGQGVAAPAEVQPAEVIPTGGNEQEPAEPVSGGDPVEVTPAGDGSGTEGEEPEGAGVQSPEERRANAARRRQEEQQAAINAAVAAARQEEQQKAAEALKNLFSQAGMRNTFTGEPITNQQEFEAWQTRFRNEQLQQQLAEGKLTVEGLNALVEEHPVVKQAKAAMATQTQAPANPQPQHGSASPSAAQQVVDEARIQAEIAEIGKLDPSVKSLQDILKGPKAQEFYGLVQRGYSFLDAFRVANFDRLTEAKAQAARQQAVINDRGKGHMTGAGNSRGNGALSVPAAEMAMFRAFNPSATEADIQAYYNKYIKGH